MPARIRVGIVGASPHSWAAAVHLPALAHLDEFTVTAVATTRQDSAQAAASTFGIRHAFANAGELAAHPEVDLVVSSVESVGMTASGDPLGGSRIPRSLAWSTKPAGCPGQPRTSGWGS